MPFKLVGSDFSGSLFEEPTDEVLHKKISYAFSDAVLSGEIQTETGKLGTIFNLLKTRRKLKRKLKQYHAGKAPLVEVYETFNEGILKGRPVDFVEQVIDEYVKESAGKLDGRVIRPIEAVHKSGKQTAILSTSFDYFIEQMMREGGYPKVFDYIISHKLQAKDGTVIGLTTNIYGRKGEVFGSEILERPGLNGDNVCYLGDTMEDAPIADLIRPGNFIVSPHATDEFREYMASKKGAFVPEDKIFEKDLTLYLQKK